MQATNSLMEASSISIGGKAVKRITLGGEVLWEGARDYEELEWLMGANGCRVVVPPPIGIEPMVEFIGLTITVQNVSLFHLDNTLTPKGGKGWGCNPDGRFYYNYRSQAWTDSSVAFPLGKSMDVSFDNAITLNGVVMKEFPKADFSDVQNVGLRIFGSGYNQSHGIQVSKVRLYDGGQLRRDIVPVRKVSDGELGMYDKVSKTFLPNQGTGSFTAGPPTGTYY